MLGTVGKGSTRRGEAGSGEELAAVDRVLATVPLRVFGMTRLGMERQSEAQLGVAWHGGEKRAMARRGEG